MNINQIAKMAQQMQNQMAQAQDELRAQMSAADWGAMFQAFRSATAAATRLRAIRVKSNT